VAQAAVNDGDPVALLGTLTVSGETFAVKEFSVNLLGKNHLLLNTARETHGAFLQEILASMVSIPPGNLKTPFSMCKVPVTQKWYAQAMGGADPSHFKGPELPVENVNWDEANAFCHQLNKLFAEAGMRDQLPAGAVFAVPTEAQWEHACRAGSTGSFGKTKHGTEGTVDRMAWYSVNAGGQTHDVATLDPNAWGLHDMHGNVWEWCEDWYTQGQYRVLRGGAWVDTAEYCTAGSRYAYDPAFRISTLGFRVSLRSIK
jgi:formylglycine-generating enzyme